MAPNPYVMAADNSPALLPLLRAKPELAAGQDEHGYSLVHAAASYNHLDLLRSLVNEFRVPVDLRDEDSETALFVVETVEAARCLVEELGLDPLLKGDLDLTAAEKIAAEAEFPLVAEYLQRFEGDGSGSGGSSVVAADEVLVDGSLPAPPAGLRVRMETVLEAEAAHQAAQHAAASAATTTTTNGESSSAASTTHENDENTQPLPPDPEFRRRIEELAARPDYHTADGQAALRQLVQDALSGQGLAEEEGQRNVRQRQN